jgi:hypothetical protein
MRKPTTHKIITYGVLILCVAAAVYVFWKWGKGTVMDAPQMLTPIATIAVVDIAQYAGKSGYDHKHGIFDNPITTAAISGMSMGDVGSAITQVAQAVHDQREAEAQEAPPVAPVDGQGQNSNMAG